MVPAPQPQPDLVGTSREGAPLSTLCQLVGVTNRNPHHARGDARATADALVKLLARAAQTFSHESLEAQLADHDRGTTGTPRVSAFARDRRQGEPRLPVEHLARHDSPLTHSATNAERAAWLSMAAECVSMRCRHLRDSAALAAPANGPELLEPLTGLLPALTEAGQAGTLLGAVAALIEPNLPVEAPALRHTRALKWWGAQKGLVAASPACGSGSEACPAYRDHRGRPRVATLGQDGQLSAARIKNRLFGAQPQRSINKWRGPHPEIAAHMAWLVVDWETQQRSATAAALHLQAAMSKGLHLLEPRLARLAVTSTSDPVAMASARADALKALGHRTTDPAYVEVEQAMAWREQAAVQEARTSVPRVITHPRLARPAGRVNSNPYLP